MLLEINYACFGGHIDQVGSAVQGHIRKKVCLVYLTGIGARNSDANRDFVFNQIGQIIIRAIIGRCFDIKIAGGIRPQDTIINKEQVDVMSF